MRNVTVYCTDGKWFGSEISWKRSGSGTYRETTLIDVPQSRPAIEQWARDNQVAVEWRPPLPAEVTAAQ